MKRFLPLFLLSAVLALPALAHLPSHDLAPPEISSLSERPQAEKGSTHSMHYRDGTEAKLGDLVKGQPYNTPHPVVGQVIGLVPGSDSCNLRVAFAQVAQLPDTKIDPSSPAPRMAIDKGAVWVGNGSASEPPHGVWSCVDYGETKAFDLLARSPEAK